MADFGVRGTEAFRVIQMAMVRAAPCMVRFDYTKDDGNVSSRLVEPYELQGDTLVCYDVEKGATRRFKVQKMANVIQEGPFNARYEIKMPI